MMHGDILVTKVSCDRHQIVVVLRPQSWHNTCDLRRPDMRLSVVSQWDTRLFLQLLDLRQYRFVPRMARLVSLSADGPAYIIVFCLLLLAESDAFTDLGPAWGVAFSLEVGSYLVLKNLTRRRRPYEHLPIRADIQPADQFSFPSGHTGAAATFAALIFMLDAMAGVTLVPYVLAVGMSRVILGVHYPTDILAGAGIGIGAALLAVHLVG